MNRRLTFALFISVLAVIGLVCYAVDATAKPVVTVAELITGGSRKNVRLGARVIGEISHRRLSEAERGTLGGRVGTAAATEKSATGSGEGSAAESEALEGPLEKVEFLVREPGPAESPPLAVEGAAAEGSTSKDQLRVVYFGVMPPQLKSDRDVILDGDYVQGSEGGTFTASYLLTQCPSKYEPPKPKAAAH